MEKKIRVKVKTPNENQKQPNPEFWKILENTLRHIDLTFGYNDVSVSIDSFPMDERMMIHMRRRFITVGAKNHPAAYVKIGLDTSRILAVQYDLASDELRESVIYNHKQSHWHIVDFIRSMASSIHMGLSPIPVPNADSTPRLMDTLMYLFHPYQAGLDGTSFMVPGYGVIFSLVGAVVTTSADITMRADNICVVQYRWCDPVDPSNKSTTTLITEFETQADIKDIYEQVTSYLKQTINRTAFPSIVLRNRMLTAKEDTDES